MRPVEAEEKKLALLYDPSQLTEAQARNPENPEQSQHRLTKGKIHVNANTAGQALDADVECIAATLPTLPADLTRESDEKFISMHKLLMKRIIASTSTEQLIIPLNNLELFSEGFTGAVDLRNRAIKAWLSVWEEHVTSTDRAPRQLVLVVPGEGRLDVRAGVLRGFINGNAVSQISSANVSRGDFLDYANAHKGTATLVNLNIEGVNEAFAARTDLNNLNYADPQPFADELQVVRPVVVPVPVQNEVPVQQDDEDSETQYFSGSDEDDDEDEPLVVVPAQIEGGVVVGDPVERVVPPVQNSNPVEIPVVGADSIPAPVQNPNYRIIQTSGSGHNDCLGASIGEWFVTQWFHGDASTKAYLLNNAARFTPLFNALVAQPRERNQLYGVASSPARFRVDSPNTLRELPTAERHARLGAAMRKVLSQIFVNGEDLQQVKHFWTLLKKDFNRFLSANNASAFEFLELEFKDMGSFNEALLREFREIKSAVGTPKEKRAALKVWWESTGRRLYGEAIAAQACSLTPEHGALLAEKFGLDFVFKTKDNDALARPGNNSPAEAPAISVYYQPGHFSAYLPEAVFTAYNEGKEANKQLVIEAAQERRDREAQTARAALLDNPPPVQEPHPVDGITSSSRIRLEGNQFYQSLSEHFSRVRTPEESVSSDYQQYFTTSSYNADTKTLVTEKGIELKISSQRTREEDESTAELVITATKYERPATAPQALTPEQVRLEKLNSIARAYRETFIANGMSPDKLQIDLRKIGSNWTLEEATEAFKNAGFKRILHKNDVARPLHNVLQEEPVAPVVDEVPVDAGRIVPAALQPYVPTAVANGLTQVVRNAPEAFKDSTKFAEMTRSGLMTAATVGVLYALGLTKHMPDKNTGLIYHIVFQGTLGASVNAVANVLRLSGDEKYYMQFFVTKGLGALSTWGNWPMFGISLLGHDNAASLTRRALGGAASYGQNALARIPVVGKTVGMRLEGGATGLNQLYQNAPVEYKFVAAIAMLGLSLLLKAYLLPTDPTGITEFFANMAMVLGPVIMKQIGQESRKAKWSAMGELTEVQKEAKNREEMVGGITDYLMGFAGAPLLVNIVVPGTVYVGGSLLNGVWLLTTTVATGIGTLGANLLGRSDAEQSPKPILQLPDSPSQSTGENTEDSSGPEIEEVPETQGRGFQSLVQNNSSALSLRQEWQRVPVSNSDETPRIASGAGTQLATSNEMAFFSGGQGQPSPHVECRVQHDSNTGFTVLACVGFFTRETANMVARNPMLAISAGMSIMGSAVSFFATGDVSSAVTPLVNMTASFM